MKLSTVAITFATVLTTFAQYEEICDKNKQYCESTCADRKGLKNHICSSQNLNYDCVCGDGSRTTKDYENFPAKVEKCTMDLNDCNDKCKDDDPCLQECSRKFVCIFKDIHDGNVTQPTTTTTADKSKASSATGAPKLNGNNALTNAPAYTFVAGTLFTLALYL